jgi:hypothetical protein
MSPKILLIATIAALFATLVLVVLLVGSNTSSRNIALGGGAILGAIVLFLTQLYFEMQGSETRTIIAAEYFIDRQTPAIRQWEYTLHSASSRMMAEINASDFLAKSNAQAFSGNREKLTHDFAIFSLLSYFGREQFDWQLSTVALSGPTTGQLTQWQRLSTAGDCTEYHSKDVESLLGTAGNEFHSAPVDIRGDLLCLPPKTRLSIRENLIVVSNSFCDISFKILPSNSVSNVVPQSRGQVESLPSGESRYETRIAGFEATVTYHGLRAQNRLAPKYHAWAERVVKGVAAWFAGEPRPTDSGNSTAKPVTWGAAQPAPAAQS